MVNTSYDTMYQFLKVHMTLCWLCFDRVTGLLFWKYLSMELWEYICDFFIYINNSIRDIISINPAIMWPEEEIDYFSSLPTISIQEDLLALVEFFQVTLSQLLRK